MNPNSTSIFYLFSRWRSERRRLRPRCAPPLRRKQRPCFPICPIFLILNFSYFFNRSRAPGPLVLGLLPVENRNRPTHRFLFPDFFSVFSLVHELRCKLIQILPLTTCVGKTETSEGRFESVNSSVVPSPVETELVHWRSRFPFSCLPSPILSLFLQASYHWLFPTKVDFPLIYPCFLNFSHFSAKRNFDSGVYPLSRRKLTLCAGWVWACWK